MAARRRAANGRDDRTPGGRVGGWRGGGARRHRDARKRTHGQRTRDEVCRRAASSTSAYSSDFVEDSFRTQMRAYADSQPEGVGFEQTWEAAEVSHVVDLADGGSLVFADLVRTESYQLEPGKSLRFDGSEAERFFAEPIHDSATLTYYHQVLLLVPAEDQSLAIGQYGALVSATGS